MATIYRFIVEQRTTSGDGGGRTPRDTTQSTKGAGKKGRYVSIFGGQKGGVEHNRKMRAINPLLNKMTGGKWEKGMRLGRATMGLVKRNNVTGEYKISGVSVAILFAMLLQMLMKWQQQEYQKAQKMNAQNYKQLENGVSSIHGAYKVSTAFWTGRHTYNQNK